ncbi:MAG: OprO/OprP family phosphate-selective porin [Bacteroidales bacterium]|nr:OprO/OprP family phosphate-selective porin [Bacteroidales bacterium]
MPFRWARWTGLFASLLWLGITTGNAWADPLSPTGALRTLIGPTSLSEPPETEHPTPPPTEPTASATTSDPTPQAGETRLPTVSQRIGHKELFDSLHRDDDYGFKSLFDTLHDPNKKSKKWYEKLNLRGYSQVRYGRTAGQDPNGAEPFLLGDRLVNGRAENFFIRRSRIILFGDISEHLYLYIQPDFASTQVGSQTANNFAQLRDLYADVYLTTDKVHRVRVGLSKVPFGFENMQSSQNRIPLDRTDGLNSGVAPNERDVGVIYYWTPEDKQELLRDLVAGGLKGSGNYGIFGLGVYNGQGGSQFEQNLNLHTMARFTWPFQLSSGQVVEMSVQGYTGDFVVEGTAIRALGEGAAITPIGTRSNGGRSGFRDQRIAGTFVYYPQPFGIQAEWNVGEGPGLSADQTEVQVRSLRGGYVMAMYKYDTEVHGNLIPYCRYQYYRGGYRSVSNAPYGHHDQLDLGVEWHFLRELELTFEYSFVDGINLNAVNQVGMMPYQDFSGNIIRLQLQFNY